MRTERKMAFMLTLFYLGESVEVTHVVSSKFPSGPKHSTWRAHFGRPSLLMHRLLPMTRWVALSAAVALTMSAAEPEYPLTEDSKPNHAVPKGELLRPGGTTNSIL